MRWFLCLLIASSSVANADRKVSEPASCIEGGALDGWCWYRRECKPKDKAVSCLPAPKQCAKAAKVTKARCVSVDEFACFTYSFKIEGPTLKKIYPRKEWGKIHRGESCSRDFGSCSVEEAEREDAGAKIESTCETFVHSADLGR